MPEISFSFVDYADSVNSEIRPGKKHFSSPRKLMNIVVVSSLLFHR